MNLEKWGFMNTLRFSQQYQNQGATVGTAFPSDLETYMGMTGSEENKIHFNVGRKQRYYKKIETKPQLHLI